MKRELIQNVKAIPYTSGDAIDRAGFLSAVVAVSAAAEGDVTLEVTHADTADGTFSAVTDTCLMVGGKNKAEGLEAKGVVNFDLDLVGCKQFIKVTVIGSAAEGGACAVVLGDPAQAPV